MELEPSVDLSTLGPLTRGFSGADLQALLYNAHLESVHSALAKLETTATSAKSDDSAIQFVVLGSNGVTLSRAERSALSARVRYEYQSPGFIHLYSRYSKSCEELNPNQRQQRLTRHLNKYAQIWFHGMWC
jgi:SpoVK/Ycf46/Vps4 family AAA+-type ATPase